MQPLTVEIVTLENVFPRNLEIKTTSSVNSLTSFSLTTFLHVSNMLVCLLVLVWAYLSCLLRSCYSLLSIKRKLSDYLHIKRLFIESLSGEFKGDLCTAVTLEEFPGVHPRSTLVEGQVSRIQFNYAPLVIVHKCVSSCYCKGSTHNDTKYLRVNIATKFRFVEIILED